jgi:glyoxylase-like metal-dependent hydrolase (beta-lactamase superfamily II)
MDKVDIAAEEVVPIDAIAPGLCGLRLLIVNVFAISGTSGWVLVDAGLKGTAHSIRRWARAHFGDVPPVGIVLTHGHFDHVGALPDLLEEWDVPVFAHRDEVPFITGHLAYPPPDPSVGGGLMARLSVLYPRGPFNSADRVHPLPEDSSVPGLPAWRWLATPGHSPGHVSLLRDSDRALIVGDAFCTTKQESFLAVATQRPELHGPPAYFTTDWEAAKMSVQRLAALEPDVIAPGHGRPLVGEVATEGLRRLAGNFDAIARPQHGRYV